MRAAATDAEKRRGETLELDDGAARVGLGAYDAEHLAVRGKVREDGGAEGERAVDDGLEGCVDGGG